MQKNNGFMSWVDQRLPVSSFIKNHLTELLCSKEF